MWMNHSTISFFKQSQTTKYISEKEARFKLKLFCLLLIKFSMFVCLVKIAYFLQRF